LAKLPQAPLVELTLRIIGLTAVVDDWRAVGARAEELCERRGASAHTQRCEIFRCLFSGEKLISNVVR